MTLNLNGGSSTPSTNLICASPTTPKICNLPSLIPLIPTPVEKKNINKNESVTVTHFSDFHGGVVEKISVPVTSGSSVENDRKSPKSLEMSKTSTTISNNPFADDMMTTTIITTSTVTSPTIKISTNPFRSSFNANENVDDKSMKISFPIVVNNPFTGANESHSSDNGHDDVDEANLSSISSVKIDNENNVTTIQMETLKESQAHETTPQMNGFKKVNYLR